MNAKLFDRALQFLDNPRKETIVQQDLTATKPGTVQKVRDRTFSYTHHHRGNWFRPEYDFDEIQIAQDVSSFMFRALKKKSDRFFLAGYDFVSLDDDALEYVHSRIGEIELATQKPFALLLEETAHDLFRYSNCAWVKSRNLQKSSAGMRKDVSGTEVEPVVGYHILPFETLQFKTKSNGELKKVKQSMADGTQKEFLPRDIIHFYTNKKPGFSVGTPEMLPALDDIALLRRIEENVEELIETNLFPVFHYQVGNDQFPERFSPEGEKETDIVKKTVEYMPSGGVYISDHRHKIEAVGSESKALRIDFYLNYFKSRVFSALGVSAVDMGEGGTANRSTASTMSKNLMMEVEAMQAKLKVFIEFYVLNELLLEGGFNPLDRNQKVHVRFGVIDKGERMKLENQTIQLFLNELITHPEARKNLGYKTFGIDDYDHTHYKLFKETNALIKSMSPGSAASEALAQAPTSNIDPAAIKKEAEVAKSAQQSAAVGRPEGAKTGAANLSANISRPANQSGSRSAPKTNRDVILKYNDEMYSILVDDRITDKNIEIWKARVINKFERLAPIGVSFGTVVENQMPWLNQTLEGTDE